MNSTKRIYAFDYLRILACFGVILLHASAKFWYILPVTSDEWLIANAVNITTRISVPLFVMISGALFLDPSKKLSTKELWLKHILRMALIYLIWMTAYALPHFIQTSPAERSIKDLLKSILSGRYHLWFLPMLMGLYALIPILRTWISHAGKKEIEYFLLLFFLFQIMRTSLKSFLKTPELISFLDRFEWQMICGYIGYFILGYYLFHIGLSVQWIRFFLCGLPFFYLGNVVISSIQARILEQTQAMFTDSFGVLTFFTTIGVYILFTKKRSAKAPVPFFRKLILCISQSTFGIYLMHLMIMESPFINPVFEVSPMILAIVTVSVLTFLISLVISALLKKIPWIGHYIC